MLLERSEHAQFAIGTYIFVVGGCIREEDNLIIEKYDCLEDEWEVWPVRAPKEYKQFKSFLFISADVCQEQKVSE